MFFYFAEQFILSDLTKQPRYYKFLCSILYRSSFVNFPIMFAFLHRIKFCNFYGEKKKWKAVVRIFTSNSSKRENLLIC